MVEAMEQLQSHIQELEALRQADLKKIAQLQEKSNAETNKRNTVQSQLDEIMQSMALTGRNSQLFQDRCDEYEAEIQTLIS